MGRRSKQHRVTTFTNESAIANSDEVVVEEPLEIRIDTTPVVVTMRLPGNDFELATGWLWSEGLIQQAGDILAMRYCAGVDRSASCNVASQLGPARQEEGAFDRSAQGSHGQDHRSRATPTSLRLPTTPASAAAAPTNVHPSDQPSNSYNVLEITARPGTEFAATTESLTHRRKNLVTGACGLCGKSQIDDIVATRRVPSPPASNTIDRSHVLQVARDFHAHQPLFRRTGGVHGAALVDRTGNVVIVREDTGRHNAVDKVIGWAIQKRLEPLHDYLIVVSSRASYEIALKAAMCGVMGLVAFSAPSSMAIDVAESADFVLVGFASDTRFNVYAGQNRIC